MNPKFLVLKVTLEEGIGLSALVYLHGAEKEEGRGEKVTLLREQPRLTQKAGCTVKSWPGSDCKNNPLGLRKPVWSQGDQLSEVVKVTQSCPTLATPWASPQSSSVHGILQAGILSGLPFPSPGKRLLISWLQSPSATILETQKIKSATVSPSIWHEEMGLDAMILVFWMLSLSQLFHSPLSLSSRGSLVPLCFLS